MKLNEIIAKGILAQQNEKLISRLAFLIEANYNIAELLCEQIHPSEEKAMREINRTLSNKEVTNVKIVGYHLLKDLSWCVDYEYDITKYYESEDKKGWGRPHKEEPAIFAGISHEVGSTPI